MGSKIDIANDSFGSSRAEGEGNLLGVPEEKEEWREVIRENTQWVRREEIGHEREEGETDQ